MPTLILFAHGREVTRQLCAMSQQAIVSWARSLV
ncbi:MAG TPA: hypothetical protein VJM79_06600 [Rhizorhapis sp.]|nr:hypothetical protein [Rhizorhapis sp.]